MRPTKRHMARNHRVPFISWMTVMPFPRGAGLGGLGSHVSAARRQAQAAGKDAGVSAGRAGRLKRLWLAGILWLGLASALVIPLLVAWTHLSELRKAPSVFRCVRSCDSLSQFLGK